MKICMSGAMAHMDGDWTLSGVTESSIKSLSVALQQIEALGSSKLPIDCRYVSAIDTTGKQLLDVWMQCARFRGVEPELVNPPKNLKHCFQSLGLSYRCTETCQNAAKQNYQLSKLGKRGFTNEIGRNKGNGQNASN